MGPLMEASISGPQRSLAYGLREDAGTEETREVFYVLCGARGIFPHTSLLPLRSPPFCPRLFRDDMFTR